MNTEVLKQAGIDYDGGVKRFMGRDQLYTKTLAKFPKDSTMDRIRQDYAGGDLDSLLNDAHELKGMCGNIALPRLSLAAAQVVSLLRAGGAEAGPLSAAMTELEWEYETAKAAVLAAMEAAQ